VAQRELSKAREEVTWPESEVWVCCALGQQPTPFCFSQEFIHYPIIEYIIYNYIIYNFFMDLDLKYGKNFQFLPTFYLFFLFKQESDAAANMVAKLDKIWFSLLARH
jgi:hypothetical protein